jgi:regulator of protease activity HflC (stomatin/prohibitin superfamily)
MLRYLKAAPTTWVMQFASGKPKRQGVGLSFFYWAPTTTLVQVPISSVDVPFAFTETTADFQTLTVQGQLSFRVSEPSKLAGLLDYSVGPGGHYVSDDPTKLPERLVAATQVLMAAAVARWALKEALASSEALVSTVLTKLRTHESVQLLGVEVLSLAVLSLQPTPEMARALEAQAREDLQRLSDEAIYERRNAAVEQERRVKESELQSEVMVEQKRRHIRETKMAADIAVEQARSQLIAEKAENDRKAADAQAYALEATLKPVRDLDWKVLSTLSAGSLDPASTIAVAFRELAGNTARIGELNISPDLLKTLIEGHAKGR